MAQTQTVNPRSNANDIYSDFRGTDSYYRLMLGITMTDGVKQLVDDCKSYWLLDIVCSYQISKKFRNEDFQVWKLTRLNDSKFKVVATDGNNKILAVQMIPYSDFPHDEATLWLEGTVILLPSEH